MLLLAKKSAVFVKLLPLPAFISFTSFVPAAVPSVDHNSLPLVPLFAVKKRVLLKRKKLVGTELAVPILISFIKVVPAAVPSVAHNSAPFALLAPVKKSFPLYTAA